jgi:hypothetical protein
MTYEPIKKLKAREFKRLCGVKPQLFQEMTQILEQELPKPKQRGGQPKLSIEDQLLIALEYWREDRTYFHIGQSWGIHESTVCRINLWFGKLVLRNKSDCNIAENTSFSAKYTGSRYDSMRC